MSPGHRPLAEGENAAVFVLGAPGYVGGGLLRRIAAPPRLEPVAAAVSGSRAGEPIGTLFPSRARAFAGRRFREAAARPGRLGKAGAGDNPRFVAGGSAVVPQRRPERLGIVRHRSGGGSTA